MSAVLITGFGIVAPNGLGTEDYWKAVLAGESGIGRITRFEPDRYPATLAGEVDFDPAGHLPSRLIPQTDHSTRLSLVAAGEALEDADLDPSRQPMFGVGVVTANTAGGFAFGHKELDNLWRHGPEHVSAYQSFAWFYAVNTGQISIRHGLRGASSVVVSDAAGGLDALAQARRLLRDELSAVIAGAVDGSLCPWGWIAETASGELSPAEDPALAYRPFDPRADGYVPGEGGALLVLEEEASARKRGAPRVHGQLLGHAATFGPRPDGSGTVSPEPLRRAITLALADAEVEPGDIDVVFADGAGLPAHDAAEAAAITSVFGRAAVPVALPKTLTGRLGAGAGPLDTATALLAIRDGVIPPAVHTRPAPSHGLDIVTGQPREAGLRVVLVLSRGRGGFHSAAVIGAPR
ncbi:ketosynthase chain-length factor [Streptomyces sp. 3MP-14]|uniref:Ketosynthase chain-length factor n=1 Tax=Streptomyces mimosae TaxID=2586635 RepID=A0A5N6AQJ7_9ACTN|nr:MULTISPECIES: ketosynthase chain-length factor [Streptomyces]KAB8169908.1 ketosynthase chain-length factor [Streptomyces mimosae]KAB8178656.1 ketosynthase chain-length factor [Streptomyces sp. 3MP-14]